MSTATGKIQRRSVPALEEPVTRKKLSAGVLDRLLALLHEGVYPPGSPLPSERELMERFQVGRPAVREALQDLQRMGLIAIAHGERAKVVSPTAQSIIDQLAGTAQHLLSTSPQTLDHLKEARVFFELGVVRLAAARATEADVQLLERAIEAQEAAGKDVMEFLRADIAFHGRIADILRNPIFSAVSRGMLEWLSEYHQGLVRKIGRERQTLEEHRQIVARIAAHDVEGAAAAMLSHLNRAQDLYSSANRSDRG